MIDVFNDPNDLKLNFEGLTLQPLDKPKKLKKPEKQ
jgi:hypothetical protein